MRERTIPSFLLTEPVVIIPLKLIEDKNAKASDILVYLAIASLIHGRQWGTPLQKEIMERSKYTSTRTMMRTITHLVEIGWATKTRRGLTQANIVILHAKKNQKLTERQKKTIRDIIEENGC